jgi:uncharacterized protein
MSSVLTLCFFSFLAGFIDSIVGGGGLIQLPALLVTLPQYSTQQLLGTGKIPSFAGAVTSAIQYGRKIPLKWAIAIPTAISAFVFSLIGSSLVSYLDSRILKPLILVLLIAVAIYTIAKKDLGNIETKVLDPTQSLKRGLLIGTILGFYDGFFGPGMGSFLVLAFIMLLGFDFLMASAHAKLVNAVTNLGSIIIFGWQGNILLTYAIPMAVFNLMGSYWGSKMAMLKGNGFVRTIFLVVIGLMIVRYGYDILK